jgi:hypothetical protein
MTKMFYALLSFVAILMLPSCGWWCKKDCYEEKPCRTSYNRGSEEVYESKGSCPAKRSMSYNEEEEPTRMKKTSRRGEGKVSMQPRKDGSMMQITEGPIKEKPSQSYKKTEMPTPVSGEMEEEGME